MGSAAENFGLKRMTVSKDISGYLSAAQIDAVPHDLSEPRYINSSSAGQRLKDYQMCVAATKI